MNPQAVKFIKSISYTFISNAISILVSLVVVLILPKILEVEEYGYFQLFIFYASFVGFLHFGWSDGLYLRNGGLHYSDLNKQLINRQFIMLFISQMIIATIITSAATLYFSEANRSYIIKMISVLVIIVNCRYMVIHILQATNRFKEFAIITLTEKVFFILFILLYILFGENNYEVFIVSDVMGKTLSLLIGMYFCRDIIFIGLKNFRFDMIEAYRNINAGYKLMFANIAGMLILGVVRFGIERSWDIKTFAKISLTLSISNFLMTFIMTIGIVIFPIIKRIHQSQLPDVYNLIRHVLGATLLFALISYFPIKIGLTHWLPNYRDSLHFMALIFPMIVFEGKTSLLINSYLKALRKERWMLIINLFSLVFSVILTVIFTVIFKNLELAVISFLITLAFKSILAEVILAKYLKVKVGKDIALEIAMVSLFVTSSWILNTLLAVIIYICAFVFYTFIKKEQLKKSIKKLALIARK